MDARIARLAVGCVGALAAAVLAATPADAAIPRCNGQKATIVGTPGPDRLRGTAGDDVIVAGAGRDVVAGNAGVDVVCGGLGPDLVTDGGGADFVDLGTGADTAQPAEGGRDVFRGGPGQDGLDYQLVGLRGPGVNVDLGAGTALGAVGTDSLAGFDDVAGSYGRDVLRGTPGADTLSGNSGHDAISGRGGDDRIEADLSPDTVNAGDGDDIIVVPGNGITQGPDTYAGGRGRDLLTFARAYSGPGLVVDLGAGTVRGLGRDIVTGVEDVVGTNLRGDTLIGDTGDNRLWGLGGGDTIDGAGGIDLAQGGDGDDTCVAETAIDCES